MKKRRRSGRVTNANSTKSAAPVPAPKKELTAKQIALQRRRKTKNKGAQHHQKDRAARKVAASAR